MNVFFALKGSKLFIIICRIHDCPGLILTYFKVKFDCLYIEMGNLLESNLIGKHCSREKDV